MTDIRTKAMLAELARQRENYANTCVNLQGEIAFLREQLQVAQALLAKKSKAKGKR